MEHMPQREILLVLPKDLACSGDPLLIVPQLPPFGMVPSPVGGENRFHLEFGKPLHDVARRPDQWIVILQYADVVRLKEPVELVVAPGVIFRALVGEEE